MPRFFLLASLLIGLAHIHATANAADIPKPLPAAERDRFVAKWKQDCEARYDELRRDHDDQAAILKLKPNDKAAKDKLAKLKTQIASLKSNPFSLPFVDGKLRAEPLPQPLLVGSVSDDGAVVDGTKTVTVGGGVSGFDVIPGQKKTVLVKLLLVGRGDLKKGAKVTVGGLWYKAGEVEVDGKAVAVMYPLEVKKEEMPEFKK